MTLRILAVVVSLIPSIASAAAPKEETPFFPIMAWNHAPSDPAVLKKMAECGITVAGFTYPKDHDLVHAAGMKAIV
jgi:hypothetical protein